MRLMIICNILFESPHRTISLTLASENLRFSRVTLCRPFTCTLLKVSRSVRRCSSNSPDLCTMPRLCFILSMSSSARQTAHIPRIPFSGVRSSNLRWDAELSVGSTIAGTCCSFHVKDFTNVVIICVSCPSSVNTADTIVVTAIEFARLRPTTSLEHLPW